MRLFDFTRKQAPAKVFDEDLDQVLFKDPVTGTAVTYADICTSMLCMGSPGSGKSSSVSKFVLYHILEQRFAVLGLCAKPEEASRIIDLAQKAGRGNCRSQLIR